MFDALIGGFLSGIGLLIAAGLLILLIGFLFGTTIGKVVLVLIGIGGLIALFAWLGKRSGKKKLPTTVGWKQRSNSAPSFQQNQQPDPYLGFAHTGKDRPQTILSSEYT